MRFVYMRLIREAHQVAFPQVKLASLRLLPIRKIDFEDSRQAGLHQRIVELAGEMLRLASTAAEQSSPGRHLAARQLDGTDRLLDDAVRELYDVDASEWQGILDYLAAT